MNISGLYRTVVFSILIVILIIIFLISKMENSNLLKVSVLPACTEPCLYYNREALLEIGKAVTMSSVRLKHDVCANIRRLRINKNRRKRGSRGGKMKNKIETRSVEKGNLVMVDLLRDYIIHTKLSKEKVTMSTINVQSIRNKAGFAKTEFVNSELSSVLSLKIKIGLGIA